MSSLVDEDSSRISNDCKAVGFRLALLYLFMLSLVSKMAVLVANGVAGWPLLPALTLVGSALSLRLYDSPSGRLDSVGVGYALMPAVLVLYCLAGIKAVVEYTVRWDGEWYSVAKGQ